MFEIDFKSCIPSKFPCWGHYSSHTQEPTQWVIDLAEALLRLRMASLPPNPEFNDVENVCEAARLYQDLCNKRWRYINMEPFPFAPFQETVKGQTGITLASIGLGGAPLKLRRPTL